MRQPGVQRRTPNVERLEERGQVRGGASARAEDDGGRGLYGRVVITVFGSPGFCLGLEGLGLLGVFRRFRRCSPHVDYRRRRVAEEMEEVRLANMRRSEDVMLF